MKNIIKNNYMFIILFIILILKEPLYKLIDNKDVGYTTIKCEHLESDYNKLLEFNEIDMVYNLDYINTYIIYKDIYDYMNEITIRGGKDKGLNNNLIIYDNTLLGIITEVLDRSSIVTLITNKNSKISVKINDEVGVLEYIDNKLIVSNISNYSDIKIGDLIYTSGFGNIEENIFIGTVKSITIDDKKIEKHIEISYNLDIKDIDYVTVLRVSK